MGLNFNSFSRGNEKVDNLLKVDRAYKNIGSLPPQSMADIDFSKNNKPYKWQEEIGQWIVEKKLEKQRALSKKLESSTSLLAEATEKLEQLQELPKSSNSSNGGE